MSRNCAWSNQLSTPTLITKVFLWGGGEAQFMCMHSWKKRSNQVCSGFNIYIFLSKWAEFLHEACKCAKSFIPSLKKYLTYVYARKKISLNRTCLACKVHNFDLDELKLCMKQTIEHTYFDSQSYLWEGGGMQFMCMHTWK